MKVSERWHLTSSRRRIWTLLVSPYMAEVVCDGDVWRWRAMAQYGCFACESIGWIGPRGEGAEQTCRSAQMAAEQWLLARAQEIASVLGKKVVDA